MPERVCECGCGRRLEGMRPHARFFSPAHRAAASRARALHTAPGAEERVASRTREETRQEPHVRLLADSVTKRDVAAALGVSVRTVTRYMDAGLPYRRLRNGRPRFVLSECLEWYSQPRHSLPSRCPRCGQSIEGHRR